LDFGFREAEFVVWRGLMPSIRRSFTGLLFFVAVVAADSAPAQTPQTSQQGPPSPASQSKAQKRVSSHDSVVVSAKLTLEEAEEGRLNDVYQEVYDIERSHDCEKAVEKYQNL